LGPSSECLQHTQRFLSRIVAVSGLKSVGPPRSLWYFEQIIHEAK
jgi:hypothetical protein